MSLDFPDRKKWLAIRNTPANLHRSLGGGSRSHMAARIGAVCETPVLRRPSAHAHSTGT